MCSGCAGMGFISQLGNTVYVLGSVVDKGLMCSGDLFSMQRPLDWHRA